MKDDYIITLDSLEICRCIKNAAKEEIGTHPKSQEASQIDVIKPKAYVFSIPTLIALILHIVSIHLFLGFFISKIKAPDRNWRGKEVVGIHCSPWQG